MVEKTDGPPAEQLPAGDAPPEDDLDEPTGLLLVDLGSIWRHRPIWQRYRFDLGGFLIACLFVLTILAGTMLLARVGAGP
jgi:hypothetical protein